MSVNFLLENGLLPAHERYSTSVVNADVPIDETISMLFIIKMSGLSFGSILM